VPFSGYISRVSLRNPQLPIPAFIETLDTNSHPGNRSTLQQAYLYTPFLSLLL
jgi:hypothetical protein